MIARQIQIDLDDAEPGMTLCAALFDAHGGILLPTGTELTESMLTSLRRRGIDQVVVKNDRVSEEDLAADREQRQQRLAKLFRKCAGQGASNSLQQSVMLYRSGEPL